MKKTSLWKNDKRGNTISAASALYQKMYEKHDMLWKGYPFYENSKEGQQIVRRKRFL